MKKHPACVTTHRDWVELGGGHAFRYVRDRKLADFLSSPAYKEKEGVFWPMLKPTSKAPEDMPSGDRNIAAYEVEYIPHVSMCTEWAPKQYVDALVLLCDIISYLLPRGHTIRTHIWNVTVHNGRPLVLDIGDFYPLNRPVEQEAAYLVETFTQCLRGHRENNCIQEPSRYVTEPGKMADEMDRVNRQGTNYDKKFEAIKKILLGASLASRDDPWTNYMNAVPHTFEEIRDKFDEKSGVVCATLLDKSPADIVDLGCNIGIYSYAAALKGIRATGIDTCAPVVERANDYAAKHGMCASFLRYDLMKPPAPSGIGGCYGKTADRLRSDGVIAAALLHHLFWQNYSPDEVARVIGGYARKWVLAEYIPVTDRFVKDSKSASTWPAEKDVIDAFARHGLRHTKKVSSYPEPRIWLTFER